MLIIHTTHRIKCNYLSYYKIFNINAEVEMKTQKSDFRVVQKFILCKKLFVSTFFPLKLLLIEFSTPIPLLTLSYGTCFLFYWENGGNQKESPQAYTTTSTNIYIPVPEPVLPYIPFFYELSVYNLSTCSLETTPSLLNKNIIPAIVPFQNHHFPLFTGKFQFVYIKRFIVRDRLTWLWRLGSPKTCTWEPMIEVPI